MDFFPQGLTDIYNMAAAREASLLFSQILRETVAFSLRHVRTGKYNDLIHSKKKKKKTVSFCVPAACAGLVCVVSVNHS